ncbi:Reticulon [Musa troglodytarum]|uniref:Reticulon n=1 Tax=Musa troglodytarum TaxID=320322 RepID=A0A9E7L8S4_9LILI|nr:Reticulon [Musa troglodytarum]
MGGGGEERWCLVTGGRGFAARHLVEMLLRSDIWCVRVADLAPSISLDPRERTAPLATPSDPAAPSTSPPIYAIGPISSKVVFHMAAPDSSINNHQLHYSVNVEGTKNVIDACIECKVKRLIYTSSPSVVFDGVHGIFNGDETMPYPDKFNDSYSETKAEGEKLVVKANGRNGLLTCCIRPSSIFGPGDRLLYIIGDGNNVNDFTYVENVAHAHICAEQTLASEVGAKKAGGQAYFITNMEPIKFWEFMSLILEGLGYKRPSTKIPVTFMMPIAHMVESTYKLLSRYGMPVPQLTPSRIRLLSCNRTFNCSKAKDQIGYEPIVSLKDGLENTIESYSHLKAEHKKTTSKAYLCLGGGKIANTLLWKDQKQSVTALLLLIAIYYYLFTSGYTLITAMAKLLSFVALFLFIHGALPKKIFGYKIEKMPPSYFNISAEQARSLACSATYSWNNGIGILRSLCKGKDWSLMFKKWEDAIDNSFNDAFSCLLRLKSEATQRLLKHK